MSANFSLKAFLLGAGKFAVILGVVIFVFMIGWYVYRNWGHLLRREENNAKPEKYTYSEVIKMVSESMREILYDNQKSFSIFTSRLREDVGLREEEIYSLMLRMIPGKFEIETLNYFESGNSLEKIVTFSDLVNVVADELKRIGKFQSASDLAKPLS